VTTSKAIAVGLVIVNGPVLLLLLGPLFVFAHLRDIALVPQSQNWLGLPALLGGFVLAWLWWSLSVPRWRLWAYSRVSDIAELKAHAVSVGLTWPDGHVFERTEIKTSAHANEELQLESRKKPGD
jgi:hypothetical protein